MPKICSVPHCGATTQNTRHRSFHQFPQDSSLRTAWLKRIGRENCRISNNSSICSQHFGEEHYRRPNNETPAQYRKFTLKPGSLPTYNLLGFQDSVGSTSDKSKNFLESKDDNVINTSIIKSKERCCGRNSRKPKRFKASSTKVCVRLWFSKRFSFCYGLSAC